MKTEAIKNQITEYRFFRNLTLSFLDSLSDDRLGLTAGPNMCNLGKQFKHIADVQHCYAEAIKSRKMIFDDYQENLAIESSKEKLLRLFESRDQILIKDVRQSYYKQKVNRKHLQNHSRIPREILKAI